MRMHNPICAIVLSVHVVSVVVSHAWALPGGCSVGPSVPLAPRNMPPAKQNVEQFPQFERDGRVWVTVEGRDYPKDWFVKNCAFMKTRGEV